MVYSMTAYASRDVPLSNGMARWELRSLNHRHLDLSFKLPEWLQELEHCFRDMARGHLNRGKIDCCLKLELTDIQKNKLSLDTQIIEQLGVASQQVQRVFPQAKTLSVFEILRWPSVICDSKKDRNDSKEKIQGSFLAVLEDLVSARSMEGEKIKACVEERLDKIELMVGRITTQLPEIEEVYRLKLKEKLEELKVEINQDRFNQEVVYSLQKMNIAEEVDRLKIHLLEARRILSVERSVGRRLDFLMQELNREVNTMASKTTGNSVSQGCIELKILIDEMREQTHNLE